MFSGARFKVTVPKLSTVFTFSLSGLKVPRKGEQGENAKEAEELSNAALLYARDKLHQLEVTIEVNGVDQGGNFNGHLFLGKKVCYKLLKISYFITYINLFVELLPRSLGERICQITLPQRWEIEGVQRIRHCWGEC